MIWLILIFIAYFETVILEGGAIQLFHFSPAVYGAMLIYCPLVGLFFTALICPSKEPHCSCPTCQPTETAFAITMVTTIPITVLFAVCIIMGWI